jgi:hydrogenase-4 component F
VTALWLTLLIPLSGVLLFALLGERRFAGWLNVLWNAATLVTSLWLALGVLESGPLLSESKFLYIDAFNVYLVALTAFVGLTTAIFSRPYMQHEVETRSIGRRRMRLYHSMFQGFMFAMFAALTTNNVGILWVAMEGATLATVLLVSLYRTPEAVEAAWKYFILCGVGIAQALFGTVLLYFASERVIPNPDDALAWTELYKAAGSLEPTVPLHNWLPDAHSEGPTPMSAILSGLLLNVALYALVRLKMIVDGSLHSHLAGYLMMAFGLLSFMVAGLFLHRQRDIKRMFSYSSIEHMGLMTFAFGLGGPLATFAALLHMTVHSLTKSAIFVAVGHAAQIARTSWSR